MKRVLFFLLFGLVLGLALGWKLSLVTSQTTITGLQDELHKIPHLPECDSGRCPQFFSEETDGDTNSETMAVIPIGMTQGAGMVWVIDNGKLVFDSGGMMGASYKPSEDGNGFNLLYKTEVNTNRYRIQKFVYQNGKYIPAKTEVIKYRQSYIPNESKAGECFTGSNFAGGNSKAWRCTSGNQIFDPCFETDSGKVVCGVDPEIADSGFELKLDKSLPLKLANRETNGIPWILRLDNGLNCAPFGGPAGTVENESFYIDCGALLVLVGETDPFYVTKDGMWNAQVASISKDIKTIEKIEVRNVLKVWE